MMRTLFNAIITIVTFPFKLIRCKKRQTILFEDPLVKSGIYIVKYSNTRIKIGRSKCVEKRLKSYRGYMSSGSDVERLLIINTENHKGLERHLHKFAILKKLRRIGRTEIFECKKQTKFIKQVKNEYINWIRLQTI